MGGSSDAYTWLKVCGAFMFLFILSGFIFVFYIVNPCANQEDQMSCKDSVESFIIILYLFGGFTLFTGGVGIILFFLEFTKKKV